MLPAGNSLLPSHSGGNGTLPAPATLSGAGACFLPDAWAQRKVLGGAGKKGQRGAFPGPRGSRRWQM